MTKPVTLVGLTKFDTTVQNWLKAVRVATGEAAAGLAKEAFEEIIATAPQYSGDFVANTNVSVGTITSSFTPTRGKAPPKQMGDPEAMNKARSRVKFTAPRLGQSIFIHSSASHTEPYAWKIENGQIALRDVNSGADHIYARAGRHVANQYRTIGKVQLDWLRKNTK